MTYKKIPTFNSGTIDLGGTAQNLAVGSEMAVVPGRFVYSVLRDDSRNLTWVVRFDGESKASLDVDGAKPKGGDLVCETSDGRVIVTLPLAPGSQNSPHPFNMVLTPTSLYVIGLSDQVPVVWRVDPDTRIVTHTTIYGASGDEICPRSIAYDPVHNNIWVGVYDQTLGTGFAKKISGTTHAVTATVTLASFSHPYPGAVYANSGHVWFAGNTFPGIHLYKIDTTNDTVVLNHTLSGSAIADSIYYAASSGLFVTGRVNPGITSVFKVNQTTGAPLQNFALTPRAGATITSLSMIIIDGSFLCECCCCATVTVPVMWVAIQEDNPPSRDYLQQVLFPDTTLAAGVTLELPAGTNAFSIMQMSSSTQPICCLCSTICTCANPGAEAVMYIPLPNRDQVMVTVVDISGQRGYLINNYATMFGTRVNVFPPTFEMSFVAGSQTTSSTSPVTVGVRSFDFSMFPLYLGTSRRRVRFFATLRQGSSAANVQIVRQDDDTLVDNTSMTVTFGDYQELFTVVTIDTSYTSLNSNTLYKIQIFNGGSGAIILANARIVVDYA